jgi:hypothetical protein
VPAATTAATYQLPGLPWKTSETWTYAQDMHGTGNNGFDFGTPKGIASAVYTADAGTVIAASSTCIEIQRADGLRHGYQHIDANDVAKFNRDYLWKSVPKGTKIGMTTTRSGCNGYSGGHHVHFYLYDEATKNNKRSFMPFGTSMNGWIFSIERDYNEREVSGSHPKSGYDYPLKKGNQIACAGTTTQNGRNICTTNQIYHDLALCKYSIPITFISNANHNGNIFAVYYDANTGQWDHWAYKRQYNHYTATSIAMKERPEGQVYDYQIAIYNNGMRNLNYLYVRVDTRQGCTNPRVDYWSWNGSSWVYQGWRWANQVVGAANFEGEASPVDSSTLLAPIPLQVEEQRHDLFLPVIIQ